MALLWNGLVFSCVVAKMAPDIYIGETKNLLEKSTIVFSTKSLVFSINDISLEIQPKLTIKYTGIINLYIWT